MATLFLLASALSAAWLFVQFTIFRRGLQRVGNHAGYRCLISPMSLLGLVLPRMQLPFYTIYTGFAWPWQSRYSAFAKFGTDVLSLVSLSGRSILYLADVDLIARLNSDRSRFPKPVNEYTVLTFLGPNLVVSEGHSWRRQQRIAAPAFSSDAYAFLWKEARQIVQDMLSGEDWEFRTANGGQVALPHCVDITLRMALMAIARVGFGILMPWSEPKATTDGQLSVQDALHIVASESMLRLALPNWATYLPLRRLRTMRSAFQELERHIQRMTQERRSELLTGTAQRRDDLFSGLIAASMHDEEGGLTDAELQGNIYIFLLAGHETTAHTLAFTLALLALNQDEQEKLHAHIDSIMPEDENTTIDDYKRFRHVRATYLETLRMFPPVQQIPKILAQDSIFTFPASNANNERMGLQAAADAAIEAREDAGSEPPRSRIDAKNESKTTSDSIPGEKQIVVGAGTVVFVSPPAVHHNPKYWPDPDSFRPERFLGPYNKAAFIPFSNGTRACIGRHFSEVESVAILAHLLYRYKVLPGPDLSLEKMRREAAPRISLTPGKLPVRFERRVGRC